MNKVLLTGRLGSDVDLKFTQSGKPVANVSLAIKREWAKEGQVDVDWVRLVVWEKTAEILSKYCGKGSRIAVEGRLQERNWDQDGQKRSITEVVVNQVEFLDTKAESEQRGAVGAHNQSPRRDETPIQPQDDDNADLPF